MFFSFDILIPSGRNTTVDDPIDSRPTRHNLPSAVDVDVPALVMSKGGRQIIGRVRVIEGIGLELRYLLDGTLRSSQIYKGWPELETATNGKREELLALGWEDR